MTYYLNCRSAHVAGSVIDPYALQGDATADPFSYQPVSEDAVEQLADGMDILLGVHGFNVDFADGVESLGLLEPALKLGASEVFFGVLWPGDWWLPVINYPFEGEVAIDAGRRLADYCNRCFASANSISFVSHSLGARLVLEAVKSLQQPARSVCLTAGAINRDCLATEYAPATNNSKAISLLASRKDWVLQIAFAVGDPIADILHQDHEMFEAALGYCGPPTPVPTPVSPPWQISDAEGFRHDNYLPPDDSGKWLKSAEFMSRAFHNQAQDWPGT